MNKILAKIAIGVNVILLFALFFIEYKILRYKGVLAVANPTTANNVKTPKQSQPLHTALLTDPLISNQWWQDEVKSQVKATQNSEYSACLFGDSISSALGNSLGDSEFNFALSGMSTISLLQQLKILNAAQVKCRTAIIAIGTNDAAYSIGNEQFTQNLKQSIALVKAMGATKVVLLPAFYSTFAASLDPNMAGTVASVEQINALIRQVAASETVLISKETIQDLFTGQELKGNLTVDGVHLNEDGKKIYRQNLLKLLRAM